jgi:protein-ribulosamine 3-kinase
MAGLPAELTGPLVGAVEQMVSQYLGRRWQAKTARDLSEFSYHPAAILSDGGLSVFVKVSTAANGLEQFETELASLRYLAQRGVRTPTAVGVRATEGGAVLVLEAVTAVERGPRQWREIGQALGRLHHIHGPRFGLKTHGYFGPFYQDNRPLDDWLSFYAERRVAPLLRLATDSGHLPADLGRQVEKLMTRLPELCGPAVAPALLHGDAQQNNFISTANGVLLIDTAAIYYGHPEIDLALVDYFQVVPADVFEGYQEEMPIAAGFAERRELWRVFAYLALITVDGGFAGRLRAAVRQYL